MSARHEEYAKYYAKNKDTIKEKQKQYRESEIYKQRVKERRSSEKLDETRAKDRERYYRTKANKVKATLLDKAAKSDDTFKTIYTTLANSEVVGEISTKQLTLLLSLSKDASVERSGGEVGC
jgi:hypothetical protein